jgi:transcriptional regulator with XRE-family HTH domain
MSSFGRYVRGKRVEAHLSLREVADTLGVTHVYLGEVERGQRGPFPEKHWDALCKIIPALNKQELQHHALVSRPLEIDVVHASPRYQNLALALQRRINEQNLKDDELTVLFQMLGVEDE